MKTSTIYKIAGLTGFVVIAVAIIINLNKEALFGSDGIPEMLLLVLMVAPVIVTLVLSMSTTRAEEPKKEVE